MAEALASKAKVLAGLTVFCAPVPKGAKVPPLNDMKDIVESAG